MRINSIATRVHEFRIENVEQQHKALEDQNGDREGWVESTPRTIILQSWCGSRCERNLDPKGEEKVDGFRFIFGKRAPSR